MCGLYGGISASYLSDSEVGNISSLGYLSAYRGQHSTGISIIERKDKKTSGYIRKKPIPSGVFLHQKETQDFINAHKNPLIVNGHTRHATFGEINEVNAQPFLAGKHTIGVHNGVMGAFEDLNSEFSDSKHFYDMLGSEGVEAALEKANSEKAAYALVWVDLAERKLYVTRNDQRTLYYSKAKTGSTLYWCSEAEMLEFMERRTSHWIDKPIPFAPDKLYVRDFDSQIWDIQNLNIKKTYIPPTTYYNSSSNNAWDAWEKEWELENKHVPHTIEPKKEKHKPKDHKKKLNQITDNIILLEDVKFSAKEATEKYIESAYENYKYYNDIIIPVTHAKTFLDKGCYGCGTISNEHHMTYWRNSQKYLCSSCYADSYWRLIEGFGEQPYDELFFIGSLVA